MNIKLNQFWRAGEEDGSPIIEITDQLKLNRPENRFSKDEKAKRSEVERKLE